MRAVPIVISSLVAVLAGCDQSVPTLLAPDARPLAHAAQVATPFWSSQYDFQVTGRVAGGCAQAGDLVQLVGGGTATHLGRYTVTFSFCTIPGSATLSGGRGAFIAANDDRLEFTFEGVSAFTPPSTVDFTSFATFVGGTGRFQHATGSAVVTGSLDAVTGAGGGRWEGTVSR